MEKEERTFRGASLKISVGVCLFVSMIFCGLLCLSGCSKVQRYKVLTFFFEGVPHPNQRKIITIFHGEGQSGWDESNGPLTEYVGEDVLGQRGRSLHKFAQDCSKCHVGSTMRRERRLVRPIPDLCYMCHSNYEESGGNLHGPIAVGECIFCHRPHQSSFVNLQEAPQPDLCYKCHDKREMHLIIDHEDKIESKCTDCHDPHSSIRKKLLKPFDEMPGDPNSINSVEIPQEDSNSVN